MGSGGGGGGSWWENAINTAADVGAAVATGGASIAIPAITEEIGLGSGVGNAINWVTSPIPMANKEMTKGVVNVAAMATSKPEINLPGAPDINIAAPDPMDPAVSSVAGSNERKRRLAALRQGLAQTIATSAQGVKDAPLVAQAQAYQTGSKGLLGQ